MIGNAESLQDFLSFSFISPRLILPHFFITAVICRFDPSKVCFASWQSEQLVVGEFCVTIRKSQAIGGLVGPICHDRRSLFSGCRLAEV